MVHYAEYEHLTGCTKQGDVLTCNHKLICRFCRCYAFIRIQHTLTSKASVSFHGNGCHLLLMDSSSCPLQLSDLCDTLKRQATREEFVWERSNMFLLVVYVLYKHWSSAQATSFWTCNPKTDWHFAFISYFLVSWGFFLLCLGLEVFLVLRGFAICFRIRWISRWGKDQFHLTLLSSVQMLAFQVGSELLPLVPWSFLSARAVQIKQQRNYFIITTIV